MLYIALEITFLLLGLVLLLFCYRFTKRRREREGCAPSPGPTSVYVIPVYEEEQEDGRELNEAFSPPPYRDPPLYSRNISPPPPYRFEPPTYQDPPAYSELHRSSSSQQVGDERD